MVPSDNSYTVQTQITKMLSHLEMVKVVQSRCFSGTLPGYGIIQNPYSTVLDPELSAPSLYGRFKVRNLPYKDNNERAKSLLLRNTAWIRDYPESL